MSMWWLMLLPIMKEGKENITNVISGNPPESSSYSRMRENKINYIELKAGALISP